LSEFAAPWGNYMVLDLVPTEVPQFVSFLPQTMIWGVLGVFLVFYVVKEVYCTWRIYQQNAYRREALSWLSNLPAYRNLREQPIYRQLPALLRRTALQAFERDQICALSNERWEHWLDQRCDKTSFAQQVPNQLQDLAYSPEPKIDAQQMQLLSRQISLWIQFHRRVDD
jgi:hypothetical protein